MQPNRTESTNVRALPLFVNPANPRQRNRLHNQAIKRAKANISKRREHVFATSLDDDDADPRNILDLLITSTKARADVLTTAAVGISPRLAVTSGGLRGDPFCAFPISADSNVLSAVDYFLQHYAPVHINPKKEQLGPGDSLPLSRRYFSLALENASMFELMVALARASYDTRQGLAREPSREVLIHYGKGVEALRLKMARTSTYDDDATILAVMALLGIALIYNDFSSFETHLAGLRHLVELRGGVDSLGWDGFIKNSITGLESLWAYHENKKLSIATTESNIKLEYPSHPFPPDLCITIAKLPEGFRDLALSSSLSLQIIALLSRISEWINQMECGRPKGVLPLGEPNGTYLRQTHACLELVPLHGLSVLERAICTAVVIMTTETFNKSKQQNPVHRRLIETLSERLFRSDLRQGPQACTMWLALVIAGPRRPPVDKAGTASTPNEGRCVSEPQRPRDILLVKVVQTIPSARHWRWVQKSAQRFFAGEELLEIWQPTWEAAVLRYMDIAKQNRQRALA
ncbi:hypothetical protein H2200_008439 [Cladophialophora chaetospira]|uniref:Tachykinin family protein n=1 Tax=Cladophialophora chaetospira TaxID=386627 RepID=A0AA38X5X3_9EURO|nr:hypothetical protein H2200_008439 [Cladophialophora chaetospira]